MSVDRRVEQARKNLHILQKFVRLAREPEHIREETGTDW